MGLSKTTYQNRIAAGLCVRCGKNQVSNTRICLTCREREQEWYRAAGTHTTKTRRLSGLCTDCGLVPPRSDGTKCQSCSDIQRTKDIAYRLAIKTEVLDHYGGECHECHESCLTFLSIDHIDGGGRQHRNELGIGRGHQFYLWLRKNQYPTNFRTLCFNCNCRRTSTTIDQTRINAKQAVFAHYGEQCACCSIADQTVLTIDHINGNGCQHRKELGNKSGFKFYLWLRSHQFPTGYQTLCYNCNLGRALNDGVCPHKALSSVSGGIETTISMNSLPNNTGVAMKNSSDRFSPK